MPAPPVTPNGNPYEFIVNPVKAPKPSPFSGGGTKGFVVRLSLIIGAAVLLMIIIAVVVNVLFGSKTDAQAFIGLAQTQNEVIRVSKEDSQATSQAVLNAATSTSLTVTTQQNAILNFLTTHGQKVAPKDLALKKNLTTDRQLAAAQAASTFDPVFSRVMVGILQDYSDALSTAYKSASTTTERKMLTDDYSQVQLLIKQWPESTGTQATN